MSVNSFNELYLLVSDSDYQIVLEYTISAGPVHRSENYVKGRVF